MTQKQIKILGTGVPYLDGAESELLLTMQSTEDRSVGSDELVSKIHDWPTEYHLSRARANLLKPFNLPKNCRVLDVGCGTGSLLRQFAEWGNEVVGIEGSLDRCKVAVERVREFPNVEVLCGTLEEYKEMFPNMKFDFIMICGVLEYSGSDIGGKGGPVEMLATAKSLLDDDGLLSIAIENKLGLKYVSGHNEDHLGKPLVGLQDYMNEYTGIKTWSKTELEQLALSADLNLLKMYAPFPDYKTPITVVSEDLWKQPQGRQVAKNFIRLPIRDRSGEPFFNIDLLKFWQIFQDLESPVEVANSFLGTFTKDKSTQHRFLREGFIWTGNETRKKKFDNSRTVKLDAGKLIIDQKKQFEESDRIVFRPVVREIQFGQNMEDWLIESLKNKRGAICFVPFAVWWESAIDAINYENGLFNFDVLPRNFVKGKTDSWEFIDYEFFWKQQITNSEVFLRSLYFLFADRILSLRMPFLNDFSNLRDFCEQLANYLNLQISESDFVLAAKLTGDIAEEITGKDSQLLTTEFTKFLNKPFADELVVTWPTSQNHKNLIGERDHLLTDLGLLHLEIENLNQRIHLMKNSTSWKITKLIRFPKKIVNKFLR